MDVSRPPHPAGRHFGCLDALCDARAVLVIRRSTARKGRPVCERHAQYELLMAERYGYDVVVTPCRHESAVIPGQLALVPEQGATGSR